MDGQRQVALQEGELRAGPLGRDAVREVSNHFREYVRIRKAQGPGAADAAPGPDHPKTRGCYCCAGSGVTRSTISPSSS
jgi:hypothetical protein